MNKKAYIMSSLFLFFLAAITAFPQETILIKNGTIVPVSGKSIKNGDLLIQNGKILKIGTLLSTWSLIAMVLFQIICRFSWFETPSWTEEASRILFIYAISFASGLALKSSSTLPILSPHCPM